jgi:gluconolactonase
MTLSTELSKLALSLLILSCFGPLRAGDDYVAGPDSQAHEGVPKGDVTEYTFDHSRIFPGTTRHYWIYVPPQYDPSKPACLYVNQDGVQFKAPQVFDNLIARHEMPVTIGVFIAFGRVRAETTNALDRFNRSYEYDGLGDNYARFLLDELLPDVEKKTAPDGRPIRISKDPNDRAIGGSSSGAICAFTAAWERPDSFRRVFSSIGTYVDQRGGNDYPALIRKTEPKPLRIFLQDGSNDLNRVGGNWFLANQEMLSALEFAGYEVNHVWGDGGHTGKHAKAIFPDAMRWLWKDWPKPIQPGHNPEQPVARVLLPDELWTVVATEGKIGGLAVNQPGEVFYVDAFDKCIRKIGVDGNTTIFAKNLASIDGLAFGPDDLLYAISRHGLFSFDAAGRMKIVQRSVKGTALCVGHNGNIYVTDPHDAQIWLAAGRGNGKMVDSGIAFSSVCLTPDQSLLLADDDHGRCVYSFHVNPDGTLTDRQPYHHLRIPDALLESGATGMTVDRQGVLYVATHLGIQMCDQAGRVEGIISNPPCLSLLKLAFGGPDLNELYATSCEGRIYKRKLKAAGVLSFQPPVKPNPPPL